MNQLVAETFNECQRSEGNAARLIKQSAQKLYTIFMKQSSAVDNFAESFFACLLRTLAVKKKAPAVERVVKTFVKFIEILQLKQQGDEFVNVYFGYLCQGIQSKEKAVRLRSCQLLALSIDFCSEMDDDLYEELRSLLLERVFDKEAQIRVQAAAGLSKFQTDDEDGNEVAATLVYLMRTDPNADVRKMVLRNLDLQPAIFPFVVERIRDIDPAIRKFVYAKVMPEVGSFRKFSPEDRERILSWGLSDRDTSVQQACEQMINNNWIRECNENIIEFLQNIGIRDFKVLGKVVRAIYNSNPKMELDLNDLFWENLIPETALLAAEYYKFCLGRGMDLDEILPDVPRFVNAINLVFSQVKQEKAAQVKAAIEFIGQQLLQTALLMEYSDETCRKEMLACTCEIMTIVALENETVKLAVHLILKLSLNQADFIRNGLKIIRHSFENATSAVSKGWPLAILCAFMQSTSKIPPLGTEECDNFYRLLPDMVVPAITTFSGLATQLVAIKALMHYCILDIEIARQNLEFILISIDQSTSEAKEVLISSLFDLIAVHGFENLGVSSQKLFEILSAGLNSDDGSIKFITVKGICQLLLIGIDVPQRVIASLIRIYFNLEFSANDDIRQALTLFFSVYPFTAAVHQEIIAQSLDEIIFDLLDPEDGNGLSVSHIAMQLTNWLDPKQLTKGSESADDCYQHRTKFAIAVCRGSCARSVSQIKAVFSIISQIPLTIDECVTKELESIIDDLLENLTDKPAIAAIKKFKEHFFECQRH